MRDLLVMALDAHGGAGVAGDLHDGAGALVVGFTLIHLRSGLGGGCVD
jgi:hypothetical protein